MLYHHDARNYEDAAAAAATHARDKLEALIERGRMRAGEVLRQVEESQPQDEIVRGQAVRFEPGEGAKLIARFGGNGPRNGNGANGHGANGHGANGNGHATDIEHPLHPHAIQQVAGRVGLPWTYLQTLVAPDAAEWGPELAAYNLNTLMRRNVPEDARYLLRSVGGEVRGWLSDRYRRLDSRPIIDAFAAACQRIGAVPCEGHALETKIAIKAMLPQVYEPVRNEVMAFGVCLENSDFGNGALSVRAFMLRLWCTNLAICDHNIREIHLGGRLADDIEWSDRTYQLDTQRMAAMVGDVVRGQLGPAKVDELQAAIRKADAEKVDPKRAVEVLRKGLTKAETDRAVEAFNSPDVEMLPAGNTTWRLSNAVSWLAGQTENEERRIELEKVAGQIAVR